MLICFHSVGSVREKTGRWIRRDGRLPDGAVGRRRVVRVTQRNCSSPRSRGVVNKAGLAPAISDGTCTFLPSLPRSSDAALPLNAHSSGSFVLASSSGWITNPVFHPSAAPPGPCTLASGAIHSAQVQLKVMFSVICHKRLHD